MSPSSPGDPNNSQRFLNGEIHQWYRSVWGYPDHLVTGLIERLGLDEGASLLDAFVGSGTTLVEGQKLGLHCVGVDANPVAVLASKVKTNWNLRPTLLRKMIPRVLNSYARREASGCSPLHDPAYRYIVDAGLLKRGWIGRSNLRRALALKGAISAVHMAPAYRDALRLALLSTVVQDLANIRYGPELYCGPKRLAIDAGETWQKRVEVMADDLELVMGTSSTARVLQGDARRITSVMRGARTGKVEGVICSPPYPAEHDYTRNTRLELAFMEEVIDLASLRRVKRNMLRSHTKNIYAGDADRQFVVNLKPILRIAEEVADRVQDRGHGFARYYSTVILEYFGGMARHFHSLRGVLSRNAKCAYVIGEQASYASVHIPTAALLVLVAEAAGFEVDGVETWRHRKSTTTAVKIQESVLLLRNGKVGQASSRI